MPAQRRAGQAQGPQLSAARLAASAPARGAMKANLRAAGAAMPRSAVHTQSEEKPFGQVTLIGAAA